jgi:hypothetical protein
MDNANRPGELAVPKVYDTRKEKAKEFMRLIANGPSTNLTFIGLDCGFTLPKHQAEAIQNYYSKHYKLWSQTWIVPLAKALVPELRERKL